MLLTLLLVSVCSWHAAWAEGEVKVTVSLANPGSLSLEILTNLANQGISDARLAMVTDLTVSSGTFNDDDWSSIQSMSELLKLDIYEVTNVDLPKSLFYNHCPKLQTITLPKNLKTIGEFAFYDNDYISVISLPESLQSVGQYAFNSCDNLQTINWPANVKEIPNCCFSNCGKLEAVIIPEGVTKIGYQAFVDCYQFTSLKSAETPGLPSTLKSIGSEAFSYAKMQDVSVVITDDMELGYGVFKYTNIKSIDYASKFYKAIDFGDLRDCKNLTDVYFRSPTVVIESENGDFLSGANSSVKIHVPHYLMYSYSGHKYWSKFTITDFPDNEVDNYIVQDNLSLMGSIRISGTPNMSFNNNVQFTIYGDNAQTFGDLSLAGYAYYYVESSSNTWAQVISECNNVTVSGNTTYDYKIRDGNYWYFLSLPFDFKVGDITTKDDTKFAIRYYDGARRADGNTSTGNWKDYDENDVVTAGTGFIIQTSKETTVTFKAQANASRNNMFKNVAFTKSLVKNAGTEATTSAHKGWNFVGNPWQCYYNIRKMNYTAPISIYDGYNYVAYSPSDDDYALRPGQAFFVQCPDEVDAIGFPIDGRQLTSEINSQNGARSDGSNLSRQLFDVRISNGELNDKSRLVVNENAQMAYEIGRDASKFLVDGSKAPQIYSLDAEGTQYAINERPANSGSLRLGIVFANDGQYTLSAIRNDIGQVILTDNETGIQTDLQQNSYTFDAKKGTDEKRFTLSFTRGMGGEGTTGIQTVKELESNTVEVYTLDGRKVSNTTEGLAKGVYVVRQNQKSQKVIIK